MSLTPEQKDIIRVARSVIRDLVMNWGKEALISSPEEVCEQLSKLIDTSFNFETGEEGPAYDKNKIDIFVNTVIRKNDDGLYLMNYPDKGWASSGVFFPSIEYLLDNYNVTVGDWKTDKFSLYCDVKKLRKP